MYQTILVPFDGSDFAQEALELACRLAEPEATLIVLGVSEVLPCELVPLAAASSLSYERSSSSSLRSPDACALTARLDLSVPPIDSEDGDRFDSDKEVTWSWFGCITSLDFERFSQSECDGSHMGSHDDA